MKRRRVHSAPRFFSTVIVATIAVTAILQVSVDGARGRTLRSGDRVRVNAEDPSSVVTGRFIGMTPEALTIIVEGSTDSSTIDPDRITGVEVVIGTKRHGTEGSLIGAVVGLASGVIIAQATDPSSDLFGVNSEVDATLDVAGVVVLTAAGAGIGYLIGHSILTDQWEALHFHNGEWTSRLSCCGSTLALDVNVGDRGAQLFVHFSF
jgi:hypothetical protein